MNPPRTRRHAARRVVAAAAIAIVSGATAGGQDPQQAADGVWEILSERPAGVAARANILGPATLARFNRAAFEAAASLAPSDRDPNAATVVLSLPTADGALARFRIARSPIVGPALAAAFPEIRTYIGQGLDDPTATARFGWTAAGFHAIVLSAAGTTYIDPYRAGDADLHVAVGKTGVQRPELPFICLVPGPDDDADRVINAFPIVHGTSLRTYRLALAATGEYTAAAGGTKALALSRIVATINRVNGIYERELAVRFTLLTGPASDSTGLIYTDPLGDPYSNSNGSAMLAQNQANLDAVIGDANYDFGHVFSTGGGGVASLRSVCAAGSKARGVTGSPNPTGDGFDVDYVAHEMGHQFGGNHTFNGTSANCGGNRSAAHASEVGSGSTIQAYAGICGAEDLQPHSDDYFTFESLNEMTAFITDGGGGSCGVPSATGNSAPVVSAGGDHTIPSRTPFTLTATASDPQGDALTYDWEQWSLNGTASSDVASASTDSGSNPLLRSYRPDTSPSRTFPRLTHVLNSANIPPQTYACATGTCLTGETLPATSRTMIFHVTARDNRAGGAAIATASASITSTALAGPFAVTSPNASLSIAGGSAATITWDAANTAAAPVGAASVRITLSTDGGATFPTVLAAATPNDGAHAVTFPLVETTQARVRIEAVGNVFFDISDSDFTIAAAGTPTFTDDPLSGGSTPVKAVHVAELRQAVDTLRARYGLDPAAWTDATLVPGTTPVRASHLAELRAALAAAYTAAGREPPGFADSGPSAGVTPIRAIHIVELRAAILGLW